MPSGGVHGGLGGSEETIGAAGAPLGGLRTSVARGALRRWLAELVLMCGSRIEKPWQIFTVYWVFEVEC